MAVILMAESAENQLIIELMESSIYFRKEQTNGINCDK